MAGYGVEQAYHIAVVSASKDRHRFQRCCCVHAMIMPLLPCVTALLIQQCPLISAVSCHVLTPALLCRLGRVLVVV